jgi:predicted DNA-binding protein YlxM (UPF0122 family)
MFEKNMNIPYLLDFYGEVLSERSRNILEMYYGDDLSLAEIAESEGISRQGIRHIIKKGEEELFFLEERLGLAADFTDLKSAANELFVISKELKCFDDEKVKSLAEKAENCAEKILSKK